MIEEYKERLRKNYEYYTKNISSDGMAISLNLASFMYMLCDLNKFEVIMDRGSGFSSYILRRYASEQDFDVVVFSIDTDIDWLDKTKEYLLNNNLSIDNIYIWDDIDCKEMNGEFDFILEDAKLSLRISTFPEMFDLLNDDGTILWNDGHYKTHRDILEANKEKFKYIEDIEYITKDSYGRYGLLSSNVKLNYQKKIHLTIL